MRIGIDATALPPQPVGAGNYILNLVRSLAAAPCEHELLVFAYGSGRERIGVPERPGFRWVEVPEKAALLRLAWEQVQLPALARRHRLDLLHSLHYTRPTFLPCASLVTFHDLTFLLYPAYHTLAKRLFFPPAMRMSARRAQALIAVSESTRQDAIRLLGIPPHKIHTTLLGVEPAFRPVREPARLAEVRQRYALPEKFILYVGVIEPRKNLPLLLRAYKAIVEEGAGHSLVVVGKFGWMYRQTLQEIEALGLAERVRFTGYIPQEDLPIVYNLASLFVYPSLYEGFGLPVLEAMACGLPVVTTAAASLPEIVGETGLLVPAGDQEALARAMGAVLADPELGQQLAENGRARAAQFTWQRTARQTLQVYRLVLEATGRR